MSPREQQKAKRSSARKRSEPVGLGQALERLETEARALQQERDRLKAELTAARERIAELEASHTDAVNRIDWVIDSLHTLLEDEETGRKGG